LDATTLGAVLGLLGVLAGAAVSYLGKRGENAVSRWNAEIDQVQEERDGLRTQVAEKEARITGLLEARLTDQVELARLRVKIVELGGDPS
jgi:chromosome segregation ATPase